MIVETKAGGTHGVIMLSERNKNTVEKQEESAHIQVTVDKAKGTKTEAELRCEENEGSFFHENRDALQFGIRLAFVMLAASLFTLASPAGSPLVPEPTWVFITCGVIIFFPSLDTGSSSAKAFQRVLGTLIGCLVGVIFGFISVLMPNFFLQAFFIGLVLFLFYFSFGFCYIYFPKGALQRYSYASLLGQITFGMVVLSFYTERKVVWELGVFRAVNIVIGSLLALLGTLVVFPRSTAACLREGIGDEIKGMGELAQLLSHATDDVCNRRTKLYSIQEILWDKEGEKKRDPGIDDALRQLEAKSKVNLQSLASMIHNLSFDLMSSKLWSDMAGYPACNSDAPLLKLDPMHCAATVERINRTLNTITLISSILRNNPEYLKPFKSESEGTDYLGMINGITKQLNSLCIHAAKTFTRDVFNNEHCAEGDIIVQGLHKSLKILNLTLYKYVQTKSDDTVDDNNCDSVRLPALCTAADLDHSNSSRRCLNEEAFDFHFAVSGSQSAPLLYLSLLEHLVFRVIRLYDTIKCHVADRKEKN